MAKRQTSPNLVLGVFVILVALVSSAASLGAAWGLGAFDKMTPEELRTVVFDDGELEGLEVSGNMSEYTRLVRVDGHRFFTEDELVNMVTSQIPGYDQVPEEERVEYESGLRAEIAELANEDGLVSQNDLHPSLGIAPSGAVGVLVGDQVVVPSRVLASALNVPQSAAERVTVTVTLLADSDVEDEWKKETLFEGTVGEFVENASASFDTDYGLLYLTRPDSKVLVDPGEAPYEVATLEDVSALDTAVYPRLVAGLNVADHGSVVGTIDDRGLLLVRGAFSPSDLGTPIFVLRDGELLWAGVLISATNEGVGVVVSSKVVQERLP